MADTHHTVAMADTAPARGIMHPLVARMLEKDPTPEALEKILKLQSDWEAAEAKRAYSSALVELKKALPRFLLRDKTVDYTGKTGQRTHYTHTSLAGAMETITPMLSEYGFSLTWKPGNDGKGGVTVTAKLTHRQGYFEESTLTAAPDTTGNKSGPQAVASTVTLLARYACLGLLGLATGDMVEPTGDAPESGQDKVDTARNMRAMADLAKGGKTKRDVEGYLGKPLNEWTSKDLDKLRAWIAPVPTAKHTEPEAEPEEPAIDVEKPATNGANIDAKQKDVLKAIMTEFNVSPRDMGSILEKELGRKPESLADVRKPEFQKIVKLFDGLREGRFTLSGGKILRPEDIDALNKQADAEGLPF